jgi:phospholipase/carboxylesterase
MPARDVHIGPLQCLVETPAAPSSVLVMLHGYAMDAEQLAPLAAAMGLPAALYFPRGLHQGPRGGRCWWPLHEEQRQAALARGPRDLCDEYPAGRQAARDALAAVIHHARASHPGLPLLLAGFSQGGMLACDALLHQSTTADALALLSCSRIAIDEWRPQLPRLRGLPMLVAHGTRDADLSFAAGESLRDELRSAGADLTWVGFDGGHEIPLPVWRSIKRLMRRIEMA